MRYFLLLLLVAVSAAQEIKRPTVNADGGNLLTLGCNGANIASLSMPLGHDAAGETTKSTQTTSGSDTSTRFATRLFTTWQTTGNTYTSLTLNVNSQSNGYQADSSSTGKSCVAYSLDAGSTWTSLRCDGGAGWVETTDTVNLSANQLLSRLKVGVCTQGAKGFSRNQIDPGVDDISVYDVWTSGTITAGAGGGPANGSTSGQPQRRIVIAN